jgi:Ca2+:H+ antiporter
MASGNIAMLGATPKIAEDLLKLNVRSLRECRDAARNRVADTADIKTSPLSALAAIVVLVCSIVALSLTSLYAVGAIHAPSEKIKLSDSFIGLVLIPTILACLDQVTSALRSRKEKKAWIMETTFSSGIRISLFVFPVAVIFGWITGRDMNMILDGFQVVVLALAIVLVNQVIHNGVFHW